MASYLPPFLLASHRFCLWNKTPTPGGHPTKKPDQSTLELGACRSWEAVKDEPRNSEQGIGLIFTGGIKHKFSDGSPAILVGIDLDSCRTPGTGAIQPWAQEIIEKLGRPLTAVSASGGGLHIFVLVHPAQLEGLKSHGYVPHPGVVEGKKSDMQLFTRHGYMALTLDWLDWCSPQLTSVDLTWLIEKFDLQGTYDKKEAELPDGEGTAPTMEEIRAAVVKNRHGPALLIGDWEAVMPDKSASEAFHMLEHIVLDAANGHGHDAVEFLLGHTAWGRGQIENSKDPAKYMREDWVERDVARTASRNGKSNAVDLLPVVEAAAQVSIPAQIDDSLDAGFDEWEAEGTLTHLPTGIPSLDALTGGGFVVPSRVYTIGAPDAGKTGFNLQMIDHLASSGIPCGVLGVDEERCDLLMRLVQRRGISRKECEERSATTLQRARASVRGLPLLLFDPETSIEEAAVRLHEFAKKLNPQPANWDKAKPWRPPCVLMIDTVQTAHSKVENPDESMYRIVTHRVRMIRVASTRYRMLMLITSEMSRAAYKHKRIEDQITDLAAAKESGAIEFSARIQLAIRNVPGTSDMVELRVAKNKHGPAHRGDQDGIFLKLDRDRQTFAEDAVFKPLELEEGKKAEAADMERISDITTLCRVLLMEGAMGVREAIKHTKLNARKLEKAREWLVAHGALVETPAARSGITLTLVAEKLPPEIMGRVML